MASETITRYLVIKMRLKVPKGLSKEDRLDLLDNCENELDYKVKLVGSDVELVESHSMGFTDKVEF